MGAGREGDDGDDDEVDLRAALEDVTFDSEDDDGFEEFEAATPEEIVESADEPEPAAGGVDEASDEEVAALFGDLGAVELDPDGSDRAAAESATRGDAATGTAGSGLPDEEEMASEVEGLLGDLGGVEVDAGAEAGATASDAGTARTRSTVLDTGDAGGFQWLGEDVEIFSPGEGEAEAMFEEFEEASPEELFAGTDASIPGLDATDLFAAVGDGTPVSALDDGDSPATADGRPGDGPTPDAGVDAAELFDRLGDDGPAVPGAEDAADADHGPDLDAGDDPADGSADDEGAATAGAGPTPGAVAPDEPAVDESGALVGESDVDAVFERFEESTPEEVIAVADEPAADPRAGEDGPEEPIEELLGDLGGVDLEREASPDAGRTDAAAATDAGATETDVEGLLGDLSSVELEAEAGAGAGAGATAGGGGRPDPARPDRRGDPEELERTGADTHVAVGESDVDAVFERFEESTPEEVAAAGGEAAASRPEDGPAPDPFATGTDAAPDALDGAGDAEAAGEDAGTGPDDGPEASDADGGGGLLARIKSLFSGLLG
jgi:hypothetical protein